MKTKQKVTFKDIIQSKHKVLVDFHAVWCGPCKMMTPILKELKQKVGEDVRIVKVDVDKNPAIAQKYQVRGVPTMILFVDGDVAWRTSGVQSAEALKNVIEQH